MRRPPMPPSFVFVIDISQASNQNGFLSSVIETIKDIISNEVFPNMSRSRVRKITLKNLNLGRDHYIRYYYQLLQYQPKTYTTSNALRY